MDNIEIKDFGQKSIKCSDCGKKLINYWGYAKDGKTINYFNPIPCPFCGGSSFGFEVEGAFRLGPIGKDESLFPTVYTNANINANGKWDIKVEKR